MDVMAKKNKLKRNTLSFYAIAIGRKVGVVATWRECKTQIHEFKGARFKKFDTMEAAQNFVTHYRSPGGFLWTPDQPTKATEKVRKAVDWSDDVEVSRRQMVAASKLGAAKDHPGSARMRQAARDAAAKSVDYAATLSLPESSGRIVGLSAQCDGRYFELACDCLPWDGCMKCAPIVELRWGGSAGN